MEKIGVVHPAKALFLRKHVGTFEVEEGEGQICVAADMSPMIQHPDGRTFHLDWQTVLQLAEGAFKQDKEQ